MARCGAACQERVGFTADQLANVGTTVYAAPRARANSIVRSMSRNYFAGIRELQMQMDAEDREAKAAANRRLQLAARRATEGDSGSADQEIGEKRPASSPRRNPKDADQSYTSSSDVADDPRNLGQSGAQQDETLANVNDLAERVEALEEQVEALRAAVPDNLDSDIDDVVHRLEALENAVNGHTHEVEPFTIEAEGPFVDAASSS